MLTIWWKKYWRFTSIPGIPSLIWANFEKIMEIGYPEAAPVMCAIDQVYSTGYRGIAFKRTCSLAEGDEFCDYRYTRIR